MDEWFHPMIKLGMQLLMQAISVNPLRPRQNGRHFADATLNRIFLNENVSISIKISLKFTPKGPINNIPALVQIMAWRRPGNKPLSEPMMVSLPTYICVTRPHWFNLCQSKGTLVCMFPETSKLKFPATYTNTLTFKLLGNFFQNVILFSSTISSNCT